MKFVLINKITHAKFNIEVIIIQNECRSLSKSGSLQKISCFYAENTIF